MNHSISAEDKQAFLKRFLNDYHLQKRECKWILDYLCQRPRILNNVHFVHDIAQSPRGMFITSACSDNIPFLFCKNGVMTTDVEKAFHDIRLNKDAPIYIQLQFKKANQSVFLAGILEENPFLTHEQIVTKEDEKQAMQLLGHISYEYQEQLLLKQIDQALDHKNKELFTVLAGRLHTLKTYGIKKPVL